MAFPLAIIVAGWVARRARDQWRIAAAVWAGLAALGAFVVNQFVGHLLLRPRPCVTHPGGYTCFWRARVISRSRVIMRRLRGR